ncbi:MAG: hypothetical protein ACRCUS_09665 [Anaerovoracaceae bacterium]
MSKKLMIIVSAISLSAIIAASVINDIPAVSGNGGCGGDAGKCVSKLHSKEK